jgi:ABC-type branched-subunit amino acid transport system ATPase component
MDYDKQIDTIKECASTINPHTVTVLTGKNGSGKSLIRKLLSSFLCDKLGTKVDKTVAAISMESRTQKKYEFSALSASGIDDPDNPTGAESLYNIDSLIKNACVADNSRYLVIDEPEIGMGEELVMALCIKLNEMFNPLPPGCNGVLIITHNRYLVENITGEFRNIEGMDKTQWLERKLIPTNIKEFEDNAIGLYRAINIRISEYKKNK